MVKQEQERQLVFPEEIIPEGETKTPRLSRKAAIRAVYSAGYVSLLGWAIYGAYQCVEESNSLVSDDGIAPAKREKGIEGLDYYYALSENFDHEEARKIVTAEYQIARDSFNYYAAYELKTDYTEGTEAFINQQLYDLAVDSAELLKRYYGFSEIKIDQDERKVDFPGTLEFDLDNRYDLVLLDGLANSILGYSNPDNSSEAKFIALKRYDDILWLAQQDLPVTIYERTFAYPENNMLTNMSRFYRTLDEDYPRPVEVVFYPFAVGDSAGHYIGNSIIYLTEQTDGFGFVHEAGHHQADENGRFSQERYDEVVRSAIVRMEEKLGKSLNLDASSITDYAKKNSREDYAETFMMYFSKGVEFRFKLKELKSNGDPNYEVVLAKYNFFDEFWHGEEFTGDGEELNPQIGDVYRISDPDGRELGIGLRPQPNVDTDSDYSAIYHDDRVKILEGPVDYSDSETGEVMRLWKVILVNIASSDGTIAEVEGAVGWVREYWLGDVELHAARAGFEEK